MDWYYIKHGRQYGPITEEPIRAWLKSGFLEPDDLLWHEGMSEWTPAAEIPELGGEAPAGPGLGGIGPKGEKTGIEDADPFLAPPSTSRPRTYAAFWQRAVAYMIDSILVGLVVSVFWLPRTLDQIEIESPWELSRDPQFLLLALGIAWLYHAFFESSPWQATLGKRLLRLKVVDLRGQRISFLHASARHFGKLLSGLAFNLGFFLAAFTPRRQALHDLLARCLVIRE